MPIHQTLIVFGSRGYADERVIAADLNDALHLGYRLLVHGACMTGADWVAHQIWTCWGFDTEPHPADWGRYLKHAGPIRNREMAQLGAGAAIGYRVPGKSDGTDGMREECREARIPTLLRGEGWK